MSDHILVEQDGPIATVVFNRPKMRNAISLAMWSEIAMVTERLSKDDSVRAIVYRGAGTVLRCPHCGNTLAKIVKSDSRVWIDLTGIRTLEVTV